MKRSLLGAVLLVGSIANAENVIMTGAVTQLLLDAENYGGCMAALNPLPSTQDARCGGRWVVFSCDGTYNSKSAGRSSYDSAVAASVLDADITVVVDTDRKHNGYCFARQVKFSP